MLNTLIVDDDVAARNLLKSFLGNNKMVDIIESAKNTSSAMEILDKRPIDLLFLDIEMPGEDGLKFATRLSANNHPVKIIFTTAYRNFAQQALSIRPYDYLVKPFCCNEVDKIIDRLNENAESDQFLYEPAHQPFGLKVPQKIKLRSKKGFSFVSTKDVVLFQSSKGFCKVFLSNGEIEKTSYYLQQIHDITINYNFIQLSRSIIVNIDYITSVNKKERSISVKYNGSEHHYTVSKDKIRKIDNISSIRIG